MDGITGTQIPDDFGPALPSADGGSSNINMKLWGIYGACTDEIPDEFQEIDLQDMRMYLGFPTNAYIRGHTWYGGSNTGRAKQILYRGVEQQLTDDAYMGIKNAAGGSGDALSEVLRFILRQVRPTSNKALFCVAQLELMKAENIYSADWKIS